jgi:hypothetical protein
MIALEIIEINASQESGFWNIISALESLHERATDLNFGA